MVFNLHKNLFNKNSSATPSYPFFVEAILKEQLMPQERESRYVLPLKKALKAKGFGSISGGGSTLFDRAEPGEREILESCIDIELANLDEALDLTKQTLNELGAPVGSKLNYSKNDTACSEPIGDNELLNVYFDNYNLAPEIYEKVDTRTLYEALTTALKGKIVGTPNGPYTWPSEVLFYFIGPSADQIYEQIEPLRFEFPIFQNARVVFNRKDTQNAHSEIRIPFNARE